ncbi:MAG: putative integral rane transport protein [Acidimicrobiaceae bacterium]|jgi:multiple sugar transport system permease protein|nr:putative integral rane transport protein [Acidimicrobiaceae bacterium]
MTTIDVAEQVMPGKADVLLHASIPTGWKRVRMHKLMVNATLGVLGIVFLLPLIWLVDSAFNTHATASLGAPALSLANFRAALAAGAGGAIKNSLYLAVVSTLIATAVSTLAAYTLSRRRVPFKSTLLLGVLFLTGLPVTLLLIPTYEIFVHLGWANSPFYTSLVLAATSVPFAVWLLKNFIDQVPKEFEEAAAIEGTTEMRILWKIVIPLSLPGILVAAILTFINSWGAFLIPLVLDANPGNTPGAVGIYQFMSANGTVQFGPLAAYGILFSLPVVVLYLVCSRWLNGGFAFAGGVKG